MYDGLLLDHDGVVVTIVEGSTLARAAWAALRDAGVSDPDSEAAETLSVGVSRAELLEVSRRYDLDPDDLWRYRDDRVREELLARARDGGKVPYDDVSALEAVDRPLGIASNNQTRIVESILDRYDLAGRFETVRARTPRRESLNRKKPRPTFLREAMADLDVENPLYVGDSESDVEAGQRAGLDVAFLRRDHNAGTVPSRDPTYTVDGLEEVVDILRTADPAGRP